VAARYPDADASAWYCWEHVPESIQKEAVAEIEAQKAEDDARLERITRAWLSADAEQRKQWVAATLFLPARSTVSYDGTLPPPIQSWAIDRAIFPEEAQQSQKAAA
jgi:hypothetical protein